MSLRNSFCILFALVAVNAAAGEFYTWAGGATGNWNVMANWSGGTTYPETGDVAIINTGVVVTLTQNERCDTVIFGTTAAVDIQGAFLLDIESNIIDLTPGAPAADFNHRFLSTVRLQNNIGIDVQTAGNRLSMGNITGGAFGFTKTGPGTARLAGVFTGATLYDYTGPSNVNGGTLLLVPSGGPPLGFPAGFFVTNGTLDTSTVQMTPGTNAVTVNSGGILLGSGQIFTGNVTINNGGSYRGRHSISNNITVNSGGTFSINDTPGTATMASGGGGVYTFAAGSIFIADLGTASDRLNGAVGSTTVPLFSSTVNINAGAGFGPGTYTLVGNFMGSENDAGLVIGTVPAGRTITRNTTANSAVQIDVMTRVTDVSATTADGTYGFGDTIDITVTFFDAVTVTGTPQLTLETGSYDGVANYLSGSGTNTLTFRHTVVSNEFTNDLDYVSVNALTLNGGTIAAGGVTADLTLPAPGAAGSLGANKAIVINSPAVVVTNVTSTVTDGPYETPDVIDIRVTFSQVVEITGTPQLTLETGGTDAVLDYVSGDGTATLLFNYTIAAGHISGDLDYLSAVALALNGGAINDTLGGIALLGLPTPGAAGSLGANKNIQVNFPTIVSCSPTQGPVAGGTRVTLTGTNFVAGATVTFGGTAGTSVTFVNSTTLQVTTPAHAAGLVDIVVTVPGASATLTAAFRFNEAPAVTSEPNATPNPAIINQTVTFSVGVTDAENDTLTITWIYGDGATDTTGVHAYTVAGTYQVRVDIFDGINTVSRPLVLLVNATGDGSGDGTGGTPLDMTMTALQAMAKPGGGKDKCKFTVILPNIAANYDFTGKTLSVSMGGATKTFTLDAKAKSKTKGLKVKAKFKKNKATKKNEFVGGNVTVTVQLTGTYADDWADEGMKLDTSESKAVTYVTDLTLDAQAYRSTVSAQMKTKGGKGSKVTYKRK